MAKFSLAITKFRQVWLVGLLAFYNLCMPLYADAVQEYTAKSLLALNIARYSEWPSEAFKASSTTINLCLLGDDIIQQSFALIDQKPVGDKILSVRSINDSKDLEQCQLLYIAADDVGKTVQLMAESAKRHILTIGETSDFLARGGMIYLEVLDAKINLNINLIATQKAGVRISSRVLALATIYTP